MGSFVRNCQALRRRVGDNDLVGTLNVSQIYAFCQHEHMWWKTKHKYLTKALHEGNYIGMIAKDLYAGGGRGAMKQAVEKLNDNMAKNAPVKTGALRNSGSTKVTDNGAVVYSRPQRVPRKPGTNRGIAPHRPR